MDIINHLLVSFVEGSVNNITLNYKHLKVTELQLVLKQFERLRV